ncbi:MAG: hypothetical protein ACSLFN_15350 [Candidatus Limnocylindrales bacterium]
MDLNDPFKGCWDRYDRAIAHREEALRVWNAFVTQDDDPYSIGLYMDLEREGVGRGTIKVWQDTPVPPLLPILFGEYFYNLRAALDYAVYATAVIDNGWQDPPPGEHVLQFPICESPKSWGANAFRVAPLSERHRGWIESVQPFVGGGNPRLRGIYWLNHMARLDRHRELRVVGGFLAEANPLVYGETGTVVTFDHMDNEVFVEDGTVIARFTISPWAEGDEVEANPQAGIDIELKDFFLGRPADAEWLRLPISRRLWLIETVIHSEVGRLEFDTMKRTRAKYLDKDWVGFKDPSVKVVEPDP